MRWSIFVQKFFVYGCIGVLIEFLFTGVWNVLVNHDVSAMGHSYLWMIGIYGVGAVVLETTSDRIKPLPYWLRTLIYVVIMYGIEAFSGMVIWNFIGKIPWFYGESLLTPFGVINLAYAPFWVLLAIGFEPLSVYLRKTLSRLADLE